MRKTPKKKLTPDEWLRRFNAAKAEVQREYCDLFKFWRDCKFKRCRRVRLCRGDADACLKRREREVPHDAQWQARQRILDATPANAGGPERTARQILPHGFYEQPAAATTPPL